jgi:flagellar biosynthesis protein FliR
MSSFNFDLQEILTFFAVLVRYSVLLSVLPFLGDKTIPSLHKVLFSFCISAVMYPALVNAHYVRPQEAMIWGATAGGIVSTISLEVLLALLLGFVGRLIFDAIQFGAHLVGNFMGFASASIYDPHQESQTDIVARLQIILAMLLFLTLDGHHLMLGAVLNSYRWVGLAQFQFHGAVSQKLIEMTSEVFQLGLQLSAPVALSVFSIHTVFGILSKAMPQLNVFILSFAVIALVGFVVLYLSLDEFQAFSHELFERLSEWLLIMMRVIQGGR